MTLLMPMILDAAAAADCVKVPAMCGSLARGAEIEERY
jgi:hypothetical protein